MNTTPSAGCPTRLESADPRSALARIFPLWLYIWLVGEAPEGIEPAQRSQVACVNAAFAAHYLGFLLGVGAIVSFGWGGLLLLPLTWTLAVGGARDLQLTIYHHSAHGTVISPTWSKWLGRLVATVLTIEPFDKYASKHCIDHHGRHTVSTELDPTVAFLVDIIGIVPGVSAAQNRRKMLMALFSPRVQVVMLWTRLTAHFGPTASWINRFAVGLYLAVLIGGGTWLAGPAALVLGIVVPLTWGYQAAQVLRLAVEHCWPTTQASEGGKRSFAQHDELTVSIRCAVAPPATWTARSTACFALATVANAWVRFTILPGDSGPNHDWHHGEARGDWANHARAAAKWEARQQAKGTAPRIEAWGYAAALRLSLESYAEASWASLQAPEQFKARRAA